MAGRSIQFFYGIFRIICILAALRLTIKGVSKYLKNEDLAQVDYRKFHESPKDMYPTITICLHGLLIFSSSKLSSIGVGINETTYSMFLMGKHWDERMVRIDYDNVTIDIDDYILFGILQYSGKIRRFRNCSNDVKNTVCNSHEYLNLPSYVSYRDFNMKCFSFDPPFINGLHMNWIDLGLNAKIFSSLGNFNVRNLWVPDNFALFSHYPKQLLRALSTDQYTRFPNSSIYHQMDIKDMQVLQRRPDGNTLCNNDWLHDDDKILTQIEQKIGCKPLQWKTESPMASCSTRKEWQKFNFQHHSPIVALHIRRNLLEDYLLPCRQIIKLSFKQLERQLDDVRLKYLGVRNGTRLYRLRITLETSFYTNIEQVKVNTKYETNITY